MNNMKQQKRCTKCKKEKLVKEFNKAKRGKFGIRSRCRECDKKKYQEWAETDKGKQIRRKCCNKYYMQNRFTVEYKYLRLRTGAKQRRINLELTFKEFQEFWGQNCYYCGGEFNSIGLDRIDSKKGYTKLNLRPCCYRCNVAKNNLTTKEFIDLCKRITKKHSKL